MANKQGDFIWYELITADPKAAQDFYGAVVGWSFQAFGEGSDYTVISAPDAMIGGMLPKPAEGAPTGWFAYIAVDDVDASAAAVNAGGGAVHLGPQDIPGVGRFAFCTDPQGVAFYIMRGSNEGTSAAFEGDAPKVAHGAWNELITTDQAGAMTFYTGLFGWTKEGEMDMGGMGKYEFLRHGPMIGAMMTKPEAMPRPLWNHYFRVADIDAAAAAIIAKNGQVIMGPHEVPGGQWALQGIDPQGQMFAIVGVKA